MPYIYTDTLPRMPRTRQKRSFKLAQDHLERIEIKMKAETAERCALMRELRVLRRVKFDLSAQTESVRQSLKRINYPIS